MVRKDLSEKNNNWHVGLFEAAFKAPMDCLLACVCAPCYSYYQRLVLTNHFASTAYRCCNGAYGDCACHGDSCPELCLAGEVCFCFWCSVFGNRVTIQQRYDVKNTACEECVLWSACILSWIIVIVRLFVNVPVSGEMLCDCIYMGLSGCMQSQQMAEIRYQSGGPDVESALLGPKTQTMEENC